MIKETTVDFIIKLRNGNYWCRDKIIQKYRTLHIYAYSFHTREGALRVLPESAQLIKRTSILEDITNDD